MTRMGYLRVMALRGPIPILLSCPGITPYIQLLVLYCDIRILLVVHTLLLKVNADPIHLQLHHGRSINLAVEVLLVDHLMVALVNWVRMVLLGRSSTEP